MEEQKAYEAMISLFYGTVFGIVPDQVVKDIEETFKETDSDFLTHCANEEGWNDLAQVYDFVETLKGMTYKEATKYMAKCPSKLLKEFINTDFKEAKKQKKI
jgi:hypothetical protein